MARIAREAGVSRPSFYFHFPTKEHVLLELQWLEEGVLASRLERANSLREALDELAEGMIELELRLGASSLIRAWSRSTRGGPPGCRSTSSHFPLVAALSHHFGEAAARGTLRAGLDAAAAARVCLASMFGLLIGLPSEPAQRRADFGLLFSLYLAEDTP